MEGGLRVGVGDGGVAHLLGFHAVGLAGEVAVAVAGGGEVAGAAVPRRPGEQPERGARLLGVVGVVGHRRTTSVAGAFVHTATSVSDGE